MSSGSAMHCRKGILMADSAKTSKDPTEVGSEALADIKQLESQLVSLNFVLKNTQSEVIKLQKTLARNQSHQDDIDKKLAKLEQEVTRNLVNQRADESFRSRFWLVQLGTMLITLLITVILINIMKPPAAQQQVISTTTTTESSSNPGMNDGSTTGSESNNP